MSYEEEFDKIIRQKASEAEYPFEESHWAATSRMIDADRAAARKLFWHKLMVPAAVAVGIGGTILTLFLYSGENKTHLAAGNKIHTATNTTGAAPVNEATPRVESAEATRQSATLNSDAKISAASNAASGPVPAENAMAENAVAEKPVVIKPNRELAANKQEDLVSGKTQQDAAVLNQSGNKNQASEQHPADEKNTNSNLPFIPSNDANTSAPVKQDKVETEEQVQAQALPEVASENAAVELATADFLPGISSDLPWLTGDNDIKIGVTVLKRYEEDYYSAKLKRHFLNVEVGGAYLLGWNTSTGKDGDGMNWFGGINYGRYLSKKISASAGIQAYNISNISQAFYSGSGKEYGFGSTSSSTIITANDLYYVALPLRFAYSLGAVNQFGLGFNGAYLIEGHNRIETKSVAEGSSVYAPSQKRIGVYEGMNRFNMQASIFYTARINSSFALNAEFVYGLQDMFVDKGTAARMEKPMGMRFSIQYFLFDK
jgi:hypothetical protein